MNLRTVVILGLLAVLIVSVAGCTSPTSSRQAASSAPSASVTATPTTSPTALPTIIPTPTPAPKIATSIYAWVPPVWYGWGLLPNPGNGSWNGEQTAVIQGNPATVAAIVNAADGTHPCGPAFSYYIDHQAAGGVWYIPQNTQYGCGVGVMPHAELQLSRSDTAKLSVGAHIFQISYPGDSKYAPAEYVTEFNVVKG